MLQTLPSIVGFNLPLTPGVGARQMKPTVHAPTAAGVLNKLSAEDRDLLGRALRDQAEYIDNPIFRKKNAEDVIYDGHLAAMPMPAARFLPLTPRVVPDDDFQIMEASSTVLSAAQERRLFLQFNYARYRVYRVLAEHAGKRLNLSAVQELLHWQRRANEARAQITQINIPLVLAMAKRTRITMVDFGDLVSEGNMALLRSVDKFDVSRGFKFSTYACRAILKAFSRIAVKTSQYRGRFPTEFDPALEKSDFTDRKRDETQSDCAGELRTILSRNLAGLTDVEQTVLSARFALDRPQDTEALPNMTLEQVGRLIGVTKERVRQIQKKAMVKVRLALEGRVLTS